MTQLTQSPGAQSVQLGVVLLMALVLISPICPTVNAHLRRAQDSQTLEPGRPIERDLKGGETHRYTIALAAGQYLQVRVEQQGIDVVLMVAAPGKEAERVNFSESQTSHEEVFLVAEKNGICQIEVLPAVPKPPAGKYLLVVEALRLATERDQTISKGLQLLVEGNRLSRQDKAENIPVIIKSFEESARYYRAADHPPGEVGSLKAAGIASFRSGNMRKAQELFIQALPPARATGDRLLLAGVLNDLGLTSARLGDTAKAIECLQESQQIRHAIGDKTGEAIALNNLGGILIGIGEGEKGLGMYEQSLALRREIGDEIGEARMLNNLAGVYLDRGQIERGMEMRLQSLALRRKLKDKSGEAATLNQLAGSYADSGEKRKAIEHYKLALELWREVGDKSGQATALHNIGNTLQSAGDGQQGLSYLLQALSLRREVGEPGGLADTLDAIGYFYRQIGDSQHDFEYTNQALQLRRTIGDKAREAASWNNVGLILYNTGEFQKALEHFQKSLTLVKAVNYKRGQSSANANIGLALEKLGKKLEALECHSRSLALAQEINHSQLQADARINLGRLIASLGDQEKARGHLQQALAISRNAELKEPEITALVRLAELERSSGSLIEAQVQARAAIALIETSRSSLVNPEHRAGYFGMQKQAYDTQLAVLMRLHQGKPSARHAEEAFHIAERSKARSLLDSLTEARTNLRQGIEPALLERERALQQRFDRKAEERTKLLSGKYTATQAEKLSQELSALSTEYDQIRAEIRQQSPRYAALTQPQPLSASEIQKEVVTDSDTLLLEYALGEEQSFLWTVSAGSFNSYELPKGEVIEQASQRVYDLLTARNQSPRFETPEERLARIKKADAEFPAAAAELSRMILSPVAAELRRRKPKQLLIVADGKLQYVPFAALPMPTTEGQRDRGTERKRASRSLPPSLRPSVSPSPNRPVPLIANYEIVNLPSASTLAVLRRELKGRTPAAKTVAVFADPVFEADDERLPKEVRERLARETQTPAKDKAAEAALATDELTRAIRDVGLDGERGGLTRLRFSRDEANAILQLAPEAGRFSALDFDANQEAATKPEISQYRYVHFATHGLVDNQTPELSGLALSQLDAEGRPRDGYLRMVEIYNLNLPAELVVLSACKTGLGKEVRGEGLMSLTRGFMYAGAARVLVSLWDVNDKSTAGLMSELYQGLLTRKLRPSAALRAAQLKLLKGREFAAPFYWAAFVQHGEPR